MDDFDPRGPNHSTVCSSDATDLHEYLSDPAIYSMSLVEPINLIALYTSPRSVQ